MLIAVGYCSTGMVHDDFAGSLAQNCFVLGLKRQMPSSRIFTPDKKPYGEPIQLATIRQSGPNQKKNRCEIVKVAKQIGAKSLMLMDTDMAFPQDVIMKLLEHKKYIVGCDYRKKEEQRLTLGLDMNGQPFTQKSGLVEAQRLPAGCLLVDMEVFRRIGEPYFDDPWNSELKTFESVDFNFCNKARALGYSIWCDLTLSQEIIHIGAVGYGMKDDQEQKQ